MTPERKLIPAEVLFDSLAVAPDFSSIVEARRESRFLDCS